uniref:Uncharacterized protein n=1 Tax=Arundo donax TaxID=35708 RepID=A0A0A8ZWM4_ARUDO
MFAFVCYIRFDLLVPAPLARAAGGEEDGAADGVPRARARVRGRKNAAESSIRARRRTVTGRSRGAQSRRRRRGRRTAGAPRASTSGGTGRWPRRWRPTSAAARPSRATAPAPP